MSVNAKNLNETEFFYGHKACAGCGGSLAVRIALKVLGETRLPFFRQAVCRRSASTFRSFASAITQLFQPLQEPLPC